MNPISKVLKLAPEAKVVDAKKIVSAQVMESMTSYPAREALLSALECGAYEKKFGKKRGKNLTLLDEQLSLEQVHVMVLKEANAELGKVFLELVQDDLDAKAYCTVVDGTPIIVSLNGPESLPEAYRIDVISHLKASESALKKHAKELNAQQGYLSLDQLTQEQRDRLKQAEIAEDVDNDSDEEEDDDKN